MPLNKDGSVHHVAPEDGSAIDKIWTCRLSGRTEMSFADALDSETNLQKILQLDFAAEWEKASLQRIHHSRLEISRLAERCVQTLEDSRIELGETVYYEPKKGKSYHCKVIQGIYFNFVFTCINRIHNYTNIIILIYKTESMIFCKDLHQ